MAEASFLYKKLTGNIGYSYVRNATIFEYIADKNDPSITKVILANHPKIEFYYFNASHNFSKNKFTMNNSIGVKVPNAKVNYINGPVYMKKPLIYFKQSDELSLPYGYSVFVDFSYIDYGQIVLEEKEPMYNLSLGFNKSFFKKKLILNFTANNLLKTYWKDISKVNEFEVIHEYIPDDRYFKVTLQYNFGILKSFFDSKAGNESETDRL